MSAASVFCPAGFEAACAGDSQGFSPATAGKSSPKAGKASGARIPERCACYIRARHPAKPCEHVEAATGGRVAAEQVRKWLAGASAPSAAGLLAMIGAYGPEFLAALMHSPPGWLNDAARAEKLAAVSADLARLGAELEELRR